MPLARLKRTKKESDKKRSQVNLKKSQKLVDLLQAVEGNWCADGDVLNLPGWKSLGYQESKDDVIISARPTTELTNPCACGALPDTFQKWGLAPLAYLRDLPVRDKRTRLYYQRQRFRCAECGKTHLQPLLGVDERRKQTTRLLEYIQREGLNLFRTLAEIADEVGCSVQTVRDISTDHATLLEKDRVIETPLWIAIDEVYLEKRERCVITDPVGQKVLHLLENNSQLELSLWLLQLPDRQKIKHVTTDMWPPYLGAVQRVLPTAKIVVDRYHVHNLLNNAIKDVLSLVRDDLSYSDHRKIMRDPLLLLTSRFHLEKDEAEEKIKSENESEEPSLIEIRDQWFKDVPLLKTAYWIKEAFSDILQLCVREKAEELTDLWLIRVDAFVRELCSAYKRGNNKKWNCPFSNVLRTIKMWRPFILNYVDSKNIYSATTSNYFAEHVNQKLKRAKLLCHGISFETVRIKAVHGGVMISRRPPHPLSHRQVRSEHKRRKGQENGNVNPDSNLSRLKKAREDRDETRELLPRFKGLKRK